MSRVAFFSNQFAQSSGHGIARYARELYVAIKELETDTEVIPVAAWTDLPREDLKALKGQTALQLLPTGRKGTAAAWTYLGVPRLECMSRGAWDVVHAVSLGYPVATSRRMVATIHDLGALTHPEFFGINPPWLMRKSLKQVVNRASDILCVSEHTAQEVEAYSKKEFGIDPRPRIRVIHEGVNPHSFRSEASRSEEATEPYFLAVGKISPRKNVHRILEALAEVRNELPHKLVLVGGSGWESRELHQQIERLGLGQRVEFLGYVDDATLERLYAGCTAFVYPSLYEGFGLPVLEAMAAGSPVIASNTTSIPEVAGDSALLVDPTDIHAIAGAMRSLGLDPSQRTYWISKGKKRVGEMGWERCAQAVVNVYERR